MLAFFGVQVEDKPLHQAGEKMDQLAEQAQKLGEILAEAFAIREVGEFVHGQIEAGAQLAHTSEILGLTTGDLQAFQYAAANAGLGVDEANNALRFLNKTTGEALSGNAEAAKSFSKLGVELRDTAGHARPVQDVLADVADGFVRLPDPASRTAAAMGIFGRAGAQLIPLLNKGSKGIDELYGEFTKLGGGLDEEFVAQAEEAEHQLIGLKTAMSGLSSTVTSYVLPAVTEAVQWLTDAASALREVTHHSDIVQNTLWTLAGVSGVLAAIWLAMNFEILLLVAAFALLALVVDDVITFFEGGDSVVGRFFDSLGGDGSQDEVKSFFKDLWKQLVDVKDVIVGELWPAVVSLWRSFQDKSASDSTLDLKATLGDVSSIIHLAASGMETLARWAAKAAAALEKVRALHALVDTAGDLAAGNVGNAAGGALGGLYNDLSTGVGQMLGGAGGGGVVINHERTVNVNVQGGQDPASTGEAVGGGVEDALGEELARTYRAIAVGGGH